MYAFDCLTLADGETVVNRVLIDRREMLKVKVKSLAEEARIIRMEERKASCGLRDELHNHRVLNVRHAARDTHIAYGLIRGRELETIAPRLSKMPSISNIQSMIKKYGPVDKNANQALLDKAASITSVPQR